MMCKSPKHRKSINPFRLLDTIIKQQEIIIGYLQDILRRIDYLHDQIQKLSARIQNENQARNIANTKEPRKHPAYTFIPSGWEMDDF